MKEYLIYATEDIGCAYRWNNEYKVLEFAPMLANGDLENNWAAVDEDIVGEEPVRFRGVDTTLSSVYRLVESKLGVKKKEE